MIAELAAFYEVTDGVPCLDGFDFHAGGDEILFEWWDDRELWLGQRDLRAAPEVNSGRRY